jgi:response regulator RpfG family c-di-GMP phosphodiesterase
MNNKILFVDDDANLLEGIQRTLRKQFSVEIAIGGAEGLKKLTETGPYAVLVVDMQMPGMSGLEFLRRAQTEAPHSVRIMLTGNSDSKTPTDAVNDGRVFHFLTKPCPAPVLVPALEAGLEQYRIETAERDLLENTLGGAVKVLTEILSMIDPDTFDRSQKLKEYVHGFTASSGGNHSWELELAASLSQIGRVTIPPALIDRIRRGIPLLGAEIELANKVPELGAHLIERIPRLDKVANLVRYQNKRFDGSGSPSDKLSGEDIPIGARILKVLSDLIDLEVGLVSRGAAFQQMQERIGWYDLKVLAGVSRWCDIAISAPSRGEAQTVPINMLRKGYVLAENLRTRDGLMIVAANTTLTPMLLVKLNNFHTLKTINDTLLAYIE